MRPIALFPILSLSALIACNPPNGRNNAMVSNDGEWGNYGNSAGGMRFSPLHQIDTSNVKNLAVAWTFQTGELDTYDKTDLSDKAAFEATPLMVDGILYFNTPTNRVFAVDAGTGKEKWMYDPDVDRWGDYSEVSARGVAKWIDPTRKLNDDDYMRIIEGTIDGRLIELYASTGKPVATFGNNGIIDLKLHLGNLQVTSPPAVINNIIVVGTSLGDNWRIDYPKGVVRAYDVRTGKLLWTWDPIPRKPGDPGSDTWKGPKVAITGAANAWAPIAADPANDMVFIPTSSPSPDYYGGERLGADDFANSLVAIKASTGKVVWHFQVVHHDLWDYDIPAEPLLIDLHRNGKKIHAVVVVTKMGHIFVMNRETGEQLFPVEERPVPASHIEGEEASPTQPFPAQLPVLGLRHATVDDAWGPTPELLQQAKDRIKQHLNEGPFTPPSLQGSMMTPSNVGGMNWSGASYDSAEHLLVTNVNRLAALITLTPKTGGNTRESVQAKMLRAEVAPMEGTPYIMSRDYLFTSYDAVRMMQTQPPWGTLVAVDLNAGTLKWEVPLGLMLDPAKYPDAPQWGSISLGGATTTEGGLTFVAGTVDGYFRAFDTSNGKLLWQVNLPAGGQSTPMSYEWNGTQYVVICAGGHGKLGTKLGDYVVAYALPKQ